MRNNRFIAEWVGNDNSREKILQTDSYNEILNSLQKWVEEKFNVALDGHFKPVFHYIKKNVMRCDVGSYDWYIDITDFDLNIYEIVADYRNPPTALAYVVRARNKKEAKEYFAKKYPWLQIFSVKEREEKIGEPVRTWW